MLKPALAAACLAALFVVLPSPAEAAVCASHTEYVNTQAPSDAHPNTPTRANADTLGYIENQRYDNYQGWLVSNFTHGGNPARLKAYNECGPGYYVIYIDYEYRDSDGQWKAYYKEESA